MKTKKESYNFRCKMINIKADSRKKTHKKNGFIVTNFYTLTSVKCKTQRVLWSIVDIYSNKCLLWLILSVETW